MNTIERVLFVIAALLVAVWAIFLCSLVLQVTEAKPAVRASATSYCLYGTTASGYRLDDGDRADRRTVAHNFLFPGTKIRLLGQSFYGFRRFVVRDTGPALSDGHFDLWSPSCGRSVEWGRRTIVYKLGWGR
jgi:3D (Asp-Asp-Asp) domain-containing protein